MSALVILRPNTVSAHYTDRNEPVGGKLPPAAVSDMEVSNDALLTETIVKLIPIRPNTHIQVVLAVSEELCFMMPVGSGKREDTERQLTNLTPFGHVAVASISVGNQQYLVATNQDYYETVARALQAANHDVVLVVPWVSLTQAGITKGEIDSVTARKAFESLNALRASAFPFASTPAEVASPKEPVPSKRPQKYPWGWIVFGGLAVVYVAVMYWFFIRPG